MVKLSIQRTLMLFRNGLLGKLYYSMYLNHIFFPFHLDINMKVDVHFCHFRTSFAPFRIKSAKMLVIFSYNSAKDVE